MATEAALFAEHVPVYSLIQSLYPVLSMTVSLMSRDRTGRECLPGFVTQQCASGVII